MLLIVFHVPNTIYLYILQLPLLFTTFFSPNLMLDFKVSAVVTAILTLGVIVFLYPVINIMPIAGNGNTVAI